MALHIIDHPLVQHKLSIMRNKETSTSQFRKLLKEIAMFMGYEITRDFPLTYEEIETPLMKMNAPKLAGKKVVIAPILRAGLGMVEGLLNLMPVPKVGHIGLYRDEKTFEPHEYYCKLPQALEERKIFVTDPMLATGGSAIAAIDFVKKHGGKDITFLCILAAPEGLEKLAEAHPDIQIYVGNLDRELNDNAYILPGVGDAGDRIFGTK
jgi:uracil phosphoribosyltransferase